MTSVLDHTDLLVKHRPKVIELRVGYDVYDPQGTLVASVVQTGRDNLKKTLHPKREDNAQTTLEMSDPSGSVVLRVTHIQALKSSLLVAAPSGAEIGRIRLENLVGKSRFAIEVAGSKVGALTAESWRKKSFVLVDGAAEIARVDMTRGSSGDFSHENDYAVHIDQPLADPLRSLAVAAVIAVDMILWERR